MHLGKNGITEDFIRTLKGHFKNHQDVKVSVLKSATRDKAEMKRLSDEMLEALGKNYTSRMMGFTIFLKKWRKVKR